MTTNKINPFAKHWLDVLQERKPEFPYVQECADCYGTGRIVHMYNNIHPLELCSKCDSRGYVIPPEWIEHD